MAALALALLVALALAQALLLPLIDLGSWLLEARWLPLPAVVVALWLVVGSGSDAERR